MIKKRIILLLFLSHQLCAFSSTYYVATNGNDVNAGSITSPFSTIQRAQKAVAPGDTVYVRGGTYVMSESQIAMMSRIWAYVTYLDKSGTSGKLINYWAYPGETPVFDYSNVKPAGCRVHAFQIMGSWIYIKGIEVTGVQVTILTHTQSECFEVQGSNNILEGLKMHNGMGIGVYLIKNAAGNLILNCDAYENWDNVSEDKLGGNTDGFGCHVSADGTGNVFRGCRAWFNSDDGYDLIHAYAPVTFDHCWAFYNGYSASFARLANGNGFKAGGYGVKNVTPPDPSPKHTIEFCLAVRNKASGFYANHHTGGCNWYNNTAYLNSSNYNMLNVTYNSSDNTVTNVPGYGHKMRNNLGYKGGTEITNLDQTKSDVAFNYFTLNVTITDHDFLSLDLSLLTAPRQPDGSLPVNNFMKLASGSDLLNAGQNIGFPYSGTAPDLGCFQTTFTNQPK